MPPRPAGVLCAGNLVLDILVRPVDKIPWGGTAWVESIDQFLGGNGANTSYTLGRLGVPVRLAGAAGNDVFGDFVLEWLAGAGVDLRMVERTEEPTATTVGLVQADGTRAFLHRLGASKRTTTAKVDWREQAGEGYGHFHLGNAFALPLMRGSAAGALKAAKDAGLTTSMDTGWDAGGEWMAVLGPCLPQTDILFVNQDEARAMSGSADPAEAAGYFRSHGSGVVVVKMGGDGCAVFDAGDEFLAPAFQTEVVDSTGAGDCFAGGFLAALHYGADVREAALFANAVGALSIGALGAVTGIRNREETLEWMRRARIHSAS